MRLVRNAMLALAALGFFVVASPSCDSGTSDDADCAYVARRCRTFCDYGYGCDSYWGCCYDRCWYDCYVREHDDQPSSSSPTPPPSSTPVTDGGTDASTGVAVLCAPCASNDDCKGGGLCIQRGGSDAGASGFCGSPCSASTGCPADFTCTQIGQSQQCVPTSGACN